MVSQKLVLVCHTKSCHIKKWERNLPKVNCIGNNRCSLEYNVQLSSIFFTNTLLTNTTQQNIQSLILVLLCTTKLWYKRYQIFPKKLFRTLVESIDTTFQVKSHQHPYYAGTKNPLSYMFFETFFTELEGGVDPTL